MASHLGRIACDFVSSVVLFQSAPDGVRPAPAALRSQLVAELERFASEAAAAGIDPAQTEAARFALVAFADELVLLTPWSGHDAWAQDSLQQQLFRTQRAGNEFYERLASLRADESDAREVFALCLAFGFQGQWAGRESERQEILRQQVELLRVAGRAADVATRDALAPAAYEVEIDILRASGGGIGRIVAGWAAAAVGLFAVLWAILRWVAGGVALPPGT